MTEIRPLKEEDIIVLDGLKVVEVEKIRFAWKWIVEILDRQYRHPESSRNDTEYNELEHEWIIQNKRQNFREFIFEKALKKIL